MHFKGVYAYDQQVRHDGTAHDPVVEVRILRSRGSDSSLAVHAADSTSEEDENEPDNGRTDGTMSIHGAQRWTTTTAVEVAGAGAWMATDFMRLGEGPDPMEENTVAGYKEDHDGEEGNPRRTGEALYVGKETQMDVQEHDESEDDMSL